MKLIINGSSSAGNSYALVSSTDTLLIEAGIKPQTVLRSIGHKTNSVAGLLVSHKHGDHARYIQEFYARGIKIYGNHDLQQAQPGFVSALIPGVWRKIGSFQIMPFCCEHDVPNYGYIIKRRGTRPIFFGTDTYAYPHVFEGVGHFLIEANYDDALLYSSDISDAQRNRLLLSHMSIDYCINYLKKCNAHKAKNIVLTHLSSRHSNAELFKKRVEQEFGVPVTIADRNVIINL